MDGGIFKICFILEFVFQIYSIVDAEDAFSSQQILSHNLQDYKHLENCDDNNRMINELNSRNCVNSEKSGNVKKSAWFSNVPLLPIVVATSNSIPEGGCKKQLHLYLEHLKNGTLWATEMFDASAKYPYGIFDGLTRHLGSFDQCQRIKTTLVDHKNGKIDEILSRYCLVKIKFEEKNELPTTTEKLEIFFDPQDSAWEAIKEKGDFRRYRRHILEMALCFPAQCQPKDIVTALKEPLDNFGRKNNLQVNVTILPIYCSPDPMKDASKFSNYEILFFVVCILIIALVIVSAIFEKNYGLDKNPSIFRRILDCFSARKNLDVIFKVTCGPRGLDSIHFIRLFVECIAVLGHRRALFQIGGQISGIYMEWVFSSPYFAIIHNLSVLIDIFFGIGGLLTSYSLLKYLNVPNNFNFVTLVLKRYFRLTPLYMFITFAYATLFHRLGTGPFWESTMGFYRDSCISYWWANFFYINNYIGGPNKCVIQSWYLAVDFQCYIIGLLLIAAFNKMSRKVGYTFLSCALFLAMGLAFYMTFVNNFGPTFQSFTQQQRIEDSEFFLNYYIKTYLRLSVYIVGLITGVIIYDGAFVTWKIPKFWAEFVCIPLTLTVAFGTQLIGNYFLDPNIKTSTFQRALYASLHRPLFTLGICMIPVFLTVCDGLGSYANIMTARWLQPISRLSYAIYLIHIVIQHYEIGSIRTPVIFSFYSAIKDFTVDIIFSTCLATFLVVAIELPFRNLGDLCLGMKKNLKPPIRSDNLEKME